MSELEMSMLAANKFAPHKDQLIRRAVMLSWFTIIYNLIEGAFSIAFGVENDAVALAGFGGDSLIEGASAMLVLWRFRGETGLSTELSLQRERRATWGIGVLFIFLAMVTLAASLLQIRSESHPQTTLPGLIISSLSLSFMFYLWLSKKKLAAALDSSTLMKDAACSLACIKLSFILFAGSVFYIVFPSLWWADAAAALLLTVLIGKEGFETIKSVRDKNFSGGCGCSH